MCALSSSLSLMGCLRSVTVICQCLHLSAAAQAKDKSSSTTPLKKHFDVWDVFGIFLGSFWEVWGMFSGGFWGGLGGMFLVFSGVFGEVLGRFLEVINVLKTYRNYTNHLLKLLKTSKNEVLGAGCRRSKTRSSFKQFAGLPRYVFQWLKAT